MSTKLGFLGAGQMGSALAKGAVHGKLYQPNELFFCDPSQEQLAKMTASLTGCKRLVIRRSYLELAIKSSWQ